MRLFRAFGLLVGCLFFCWAQASEQSVPKHVLIHDYPYAVELRENIELTRQIRPDDGRLAGSHYYGKLMGHDDSWVRVSLINGKWQGIVSLAGQVYLVEMPSEQLVGPMKVGTQGVDAPLLASPVSEFQPVVCGVKHPEHAKSLIDPHVHSALQAPKEVQFSSLCEKKVDGVCLLAEVEFVFDQAFQQEFSGDAREQAESLINMAEGFYRNDLSVIFDTITLELLDSNVFDTTVVGGDLLADMKTKKAGGQLSFVKNNRALLHLVTGRELTNDEDEDGLAGVAYVNGLCDQFGFSSGVSQLLHRFNGSPDIRLTAVIVAHELGHNFGANHDVDDNSCGAGFIMEPTVSSGANHFSDCSQGQIENAISDLSSPESCFNFPIAISYTGLNSNVFSVASGQALTLNYTVFVDEGFQQVETFQITGSVLSTQGRFDEVSLGSVPCEISTDNLSYDCRQNNPPESSLLSFTVHSAGTSTELIVTNNLDVIGMNDIESLRNIYPESSTLIASITVSLVAPAPASNLIAHSFTGNEVDLQWIDNSDNQEGFRIERRFNGGNFVEVASIAINTIRGGVAVYRGDVVDGDLDDYEYRVIAFNSAGDSAPSNIASTAILVLPYVASGLTAVQGAGANVILKWNNSSFNADGIRIERRAVDGDFVELVTVSNDTLEFIDASSEAGSMYEYRVIAFNGVGDAEASNIVSITIEGLPAAPSSVSVSQANGTQTSVSWQDNSDNETGFRVERRIGNGSFSELTTVGENATTYTDASSNAGTNYGYRVVAYNNLGDSVASNIASITPTNPTPPAPPSPPAPSGGGGGSTSWALLLIMSLLWFRRRNDVGVTV